MFFFPVRNVKDRRLNGLSVDFNNFFIKCFGKFSDVFECESCLYKALIVLYSYIKTFLLIIICISSFF